MLTQSQLPIPLQLPRARNPPRQSIRSTRISCLNVSSTYGSCSSSPTWMPGRSRRYVIFPGEGDRPKLIWEWTQAGEFAMETAEMVGTYGRRSMDQLAAKVYFYLARAYELQGRLSELQP